jgi:prepilin peptidase CpaA
LCMPLVGIEAEMHAFIAAMIFAPARLAWEGKLWRTLGRTMAILANPFLPKEKRREVAPEMMTWLRFGPAIFAGIAVSAIAHWRGQ